MRQTKDSSTAILAGLIAISLMGAGPLAAQLGGSARPVTLEQKGLLRCAAAFAIVSEGQVRGNPEALGWPPLGERGKEFFVRVSAQLMDSTGLDRTAVAALLRHEAQSLKEDGHIQQVMPSCLIMLESSGV